MKDMAEKDLEQPFDPHRKVSREELLAEVDRHEAFLKERSFSKQEIQSSLIYLKETLGLMPENDDLIFVNAEKVKAMEFKNQEEVVGKGILPVGGGLIFVAESGIGKSMITLEISIHLAMGWNLYDLPIEKPWKTLIIQFENPERTQNYRLQKMLQHFMVDSLNRNLIVSNQKLRFDLKLKRDREKALNLVKKSGAEVVILDPLQSLHSESENDNIGMRQVLDTITHINREAGTSAILVHHFGKPTEGYELNHRIRGASSIRDWADTIITITKKPHSHKILRKLTFTKVRNGPEHPPILLQRDTKYFTHSVVEEETLVSPYKVAEILQSLGGRIESQTQLIEAIAEETGCGKRSAVKYIKEAVGVTVNEFKTSGKMKGYQVK